MGGARVTAADSRIAQRIKQRRLALGLSQMQVAAALGVTYQQFQKYEKGTNRVAGSRLQALAAALQMSIADLLGEEGDDASLIIPELSRDDYRLLAAFGKLPTDMRKSLLGVVESLASEVELRIATKVASAS
jgi:transcriptional regulator with XRE-family HTH domain